MVNKARVVQGTINDPERPLVTVNVTAHREGYLLHKSLVAVLASVEHAFQEDGVVSKIRVHLDNADTNTKEVANNFVSEVANKNLEIKLYENSFGDLATSRNFLIDLTDTKYTLFWDGDDFFTHNFISEAIAIAEQHKEPCVVSADSIIKFSNRIDPIIYRPKSTVESPQIKSAIFETNLYISQNLTSTEIFKKCRYLPNQDCYGFEDWHWNTQVIDEGYEFLVAHGTTFFYRQKPDDKSLLKQSLNSNTILRPSKLFSPDRFRLLPQTPYYHFESSPIEQVEVDSGNKIKTQGKRLIGKIAPKDSMFYKINKHLYRSTQQFLAPVVHAMRHRGSVDELMDPHLTNTDTLMRYTPSHQEIKLWNRLNKIEPLIYIDEAVMIGLKNYEYGFEHAFATVYHDFCASYGNFGLTDIVFVPWVRQGGADLAMIDLVSLLSSKGRKILVVTTSGQDSSWANRLTSLEGVVFLESHDEKFSQLDHTYLKLFFVRMIQNWKIKTVTVMNSAIGFELFNRHGKAIKDAGCTTIVHSYALPSLGELTLEPFPDFALGLSTIDKVIVDSNTHANKLNRLYGFPLSSLIKLPLPMTEGLQVNTGTISHKVLFANRIAREKQPDIAIRTAKILQTDSIVFDIFGTKDEEYCKEIMFDNLVDDAENVTFKGSFNGVESLDFGDYDICFMPSLYEGIPRIVLDSIKAGIFVVGSDVGGMPECIENEKNGILLDVSSGPEQYANAIRKFYADEGLRDVSRRVQASKSVIALHSRENYARLIEKAYGVAKRG